MALADIVTRMPALLPGSLVPLLGTRQPIFGLSALLTEVKSA